jgi:hypothetical protein
MGLGVGDKERKLLGPEGERMSNSGVVKRIYSEVVLFVVFLNSIHICVYVFECVFVCVCVCVCMNVVFYAQCDV